eukprot:CAMPEP_0171886056 /NCGR_PEP_ID=MMETSP0992-20121227/41679_1 /TAXON_ID=483369 /ORGANISM="non described non described, Strain CCMP2098" /LENGTH=157 /DNA_ID=CAMNT_0012512653 /DNA_START=45 /DNA_END=515 /DNA_ORIENTATION=+
MISVTLRLVGSNSSSASSRVRFSPDTSERGINNVLCAAVGLPIMGSSIILKDDEGFLVPVSPHLTEGLEYTVLEVPALSPNHRRGGVAPFGDDPRAATQRNPIYRDSLREPLVPSGSLNGPLAAPQEETRIENRLPEVTKFERMSSHLANERTFLAW